MARSRRQSRIVPRVFGRRLKSEGLRVLTAVRYGEAAKEILAIGGSPDRPMVAAATHGRKY